MEMIKKHTITILLLTIATTSLLNAQIIFDGYGKLSWGESLDTIRNIQTTDNIDFVYESNHTYVIGDELELDNKNIHTEEVYFVFNENDEFFKAVILLDDENFNKYENYFIELIGEADKEVDNNKKEASMWQHENTNIYMMMDYTENRDNIMIIKNTIYEIKYSENYELHR